MTRRPKGRHAVYVGEIPDCSDEPLKFWWPQSIVDLPDRLANVNVHESDLTLCEAAMLVRDYNRGQLARAIPEGLWAFLVFRVKGGAPNSTTKGQTP